MIRRLVDSGEGWGFDVRSGPTYKTVTYGFWAEERRYFGYIVNKGSLLFYFRAPLLKKMKGFHGLITASGLHFTKSRRGEYQVRILDEPDCESVIRFIDSEIVEHLGLAKLRGNSPASASKNSRPAVDLEAQDLSDGELEDAFLEDRVMFCGEIETGSTVGEARRRRGQAKLRELVLRNYNSTCALCDVNDRGLLVASHIIGWSERTDTRGRLSNAVCLCRFHDALFENGYWSLSDDLRVLSRSPIKSGTIRSVLPANISFRRPTSYIPAGEYVRHHRARHGL
jgi:hypothetical protein